MSNELQEQLIDLKAECESLKSQLIRYKKEIEIHKCEISTLKETNEEITNKYNSSTDKLHQISTQLNSYNDLHTNFDKINTKNITLNKEIVETKKHIKHYESENQKLINQIKDYKLKFSQNDRLNKSKNKLLDNHKQIELTQISKIKELQDQIQILNSQLTMLKSNPSFDDDDEKAHTLGYLPALKQNDTLKIKAKGLFTPTDYPTVQRQNSGFSITSAVTPAKTYNHISGYNQFSPLSNSDETNGDGNIANVGSMGTMCADQSIVSTTSTVGGTVLLNAYENVNVLQQNENEYQLLLLQQKQKQDEEIKMLIEKKRNEFEEQIRKIKKENNNLKRENMAMKQRLKNAWEIGCIGQLWSNDIND